MNVSDKTLRMVAHAVRAAIKASADEAEIGRIALEAFAEYASLSDWDALESEKP